MPFIQCEKCKWIHRTADDCCPFGGRAQSISMDGKIYYNPTHYSPDGLNKQQSEPGAKKN